ncbi:MAG: hypothetical protein ACJAT7_003254 [Psychromonas sp.]
MSDFQADDESNCYASQNKSHCRSETRLHNVNHDSALLGDIAFEWPGIKTLGYMSRLDKREKSQ